MFIHRGLQIVFRLFGYLVRAQVFRRPLGHQELDLINGHAHLAQQAAVGCDFQ